MSREYEIRMYNINETKLKKLIKDKGGTRKTKKTFFLIYSYENDNLPNTVIRLRNEGNYTTMTIKSDLKSKYPIENEMIVSDIEEGHKIVTAMGCRRKYIIEKIRQIFVIDDCEIMFDQYPGLPPYVEFEAPTEAKLKKALKKLNYSVNDHDSRKLEHFMEELYGISTDRQKNNSLTFKNAKQILGPFIKKNKDKFNKILSNQKKYLKI